jgi:hypothetical protein
LPQYASVRRRGALEAGDEMTNDESGGSDSGAPGSPGARGGRRRRPPSTIELEATEISEPRPAGGSAQGAPDPEPAADPAPAEPQFAREAPDRHGGGIWGRIVAGVGGAAIAALVLGGLWAFGQLPRSPNAAGNGALSAKVAALEGQVREVAARTQAPDARRAEEIDARLTRLESSFAAGRAGSDPALTEKLADLDRRLEQASAAGRAAAQPPQTAANPAERAELDALAARVANLEQQVKAGEQRLGKVAAGADRMVRLALVAMELRVAVERGAPYAAELAAAKQFAPDASGLAPLEAAAATGVPAPAALSQNLSKLMPAMLEAARAPQRDAGVIERLQASAARLVRIRPVEEAPGDDASTVIARAELRATRGDIAGAVAELERLPEPVRAPAAGWIAAAKARLAAIEAAKKLAANALEALAKPAE